MSLRTKIVAYLLVVFAAYGTLNYTILRTLIYPSFLALEREEATRDAERCVEAVRGEIRHLDRLCKGWAAWDDTYRFAVDGNREYIETNLVARSFLLNDLTTILIFDEAGAVIWGKGVAPEGGAPEPAPEFWGPDLPAMYPLLAPAGAGDARAGILPTRRGAMLVASRPILTSEEEGPSRGTFVVGRLLSEGWIRALREQTRVEFRVSSFPFGDLPDGMDTWMASSQEQAVRILDGEEGRLHAYTWLAGPDGGPALLIRADLPGEIQARGGTAVRFANLSIVAVGLVLLVVSWTLVHRSVVGPLKRLTDHATAVAKNGDPSPSAPSAAGADEIGLLASQFDRTVEELARARQRLAERSYGEGMAQAASNVLHDVRNALTPLTVKLDGLRNEIRGMPLEEMASVHAELASGQVPEERSADLLRFFDVVVQDLRHRLERAGGRVEDVARVAMQIEGVLAVQEELTRPAPDDREPVEKAKT